ncbi:hypothetical protein [Longitalea arenae]|uniref:hypothetical protein n=1 Tax=Longitalea arenae TaxID=2812558 RepID=UPI0019679A3D|nr:hypothetical protein [Longitalea arenae]
MARAVSRRNFILTASGLAVATARINRLMAATNTARQEDEGDLYPLSQSLSATWASTLLGLQLQDAAPSRFGGIRCPGTERIHGRIGDTIYPFMHMARRTGDNRYLDASVQLFRWMEANVSQPDGSWLNEINDKWKGTTVFTVIALCEALRFHGELMEPNFKNALHERLSKAGEWINANVTIDYGNINYPIAASYALSLLGTIQDKPAHRKKGRLLVQQAMKFFTRKDRFIFGEGTPYYQPSRKGSYSVDLGYNVEESLPSLALYGLLNKEEEILQRVTASLQTHMEFLLPDGGWDNSWGTRNYKWTYWGSRTSDGCQPAYALLAYRDLRFYRVAVKNTLLLQQCTIDGLLAGGPHYSSHKIQPGVHHTFCHLKALTTILDHGINNHYREKTTIRSGGPAVETLIPRETAYGLRFFKDIQTWLVATGKFRATVTGYDREYKAMRNGHASGGALTMLWHEQTGPLLVASMNAYQLVEAGNMQADADPLSMPLTFRAELTVGGFTYMNISYLDAKIDASKDGDRIVIKTSSRLVDKDQNDPPEAPVYCQAEYVFTPERISVSLQCKSTAQAYLNDVRIVVPVIAESTETVQPVGENRFLIHKSKVLVSISADQPLNLLPTTGERLFNFVPGLEAVPFVIPEPEGTIVFGIRDYV